MLDFYFIPDDQPFREEDARTLERAGGIEMDMFDRLQRKGIIDQRFAYYDDFRWESTLVKQLHEQVCSAKFAADTDAKHLLQILDRAMERGSGLMALCD